jgi:hypothetical protein
VKYIAELVYGETNTEVLEQSVRWVIIIIVLVFDPLALILVLAGLSILHREPVDNQPEILHNDIIPDLDDPELADTILPEVSGPTTSAQPPTPNHNQRRAPKGEVIINGRNTDNRTPNEK